MRQAPREGITKNKHGEEAHYIFLEYLCEYLNGEAVPGDDIAQLQWVEKEDLKKTLGIKNLYSYTHSRNVPSIKVAQNAGMLHYKTFTHILDGIKTESIIHFMNLNK